MTTPAKDMGRLGFAISARDFQPRRLLTNGHLQTIVGNFLPRHLHLPDPEAVLVEVAAPSIIAGHAEPAAQVLCHCHWQPAEVRAAALTVVILHGLEGSSSSQYVLGNADKLWHAGANVVRMNSAQLRRHGGALAHALPLRAFRRCACGDALFRRARGASGAWRSSATPWAATWC